MYRGIIVDNLKEKVKELRQKKGWTQEELAQQIGVTLSTIQRWEKKGGQPSRLPRREIIRLLRSAGIYEEQTYE